MTIMMITCARCGTPIEAEPGNDAENDRMQVCDPCARAIHDWLQSAGL